MDNGNYDEEMEKVRNEIMEAIENLAAMTQREFMALRGEMQEMGEDLRTELRGEIKEMGDELRGEMRGMRNELHGEIRAVRNDLGGVMQTAQGELHDQIEDLRQETRAGFAATSGMVANHEYRIERVEKKLDIA